MKFSRITSSIAMVLCLFFAAGCASTPTQSSTGELIDDTIITTKVKTAIFSEKELSAVQINVETFKGVVQLSGFVGERSDIAKATAVTRKVKGVVSVKNNIVVK